MIRRQGQPDLRVMAELDLEQLAPDVRAPLPRFEMKDPPSRTWHRLTDQERVRGDRGRLLPKRHKVAFEPT